VREGGIGEGAKGVVVPEGVGRGRGIERKRKVFGGGKGG
jgi:hypothetical protein